MTNPPLDDDWSWIDSWDYAEDEFDTAFDFDYFYDDDDPSNTPLDEFTLMITASNLCDSTTVEPSVWVRNLSPTVESLHIENADLLAEGRSFDLEVTIADPGWYDTHTLIVDWGDGMVEELPDPGWSTEYDETDPDTNRLKAYVPHTYPDDGTFQILVTVRDDDGGEVVADPFVVSPRNLAPTLDSLAVEPVEDGQPEDEQNNQIDEGERFKITGNLTDEGIDDEHTATVEVYWENGGSTLPLIGTFEGELTKDDSGAFTFTSDDPIVDDGPSDWFLFQENNGTLWDEYSFVIQVTDDDGGLSGPYPVNDYVYNVEPEFTVAPELTVEYDENGNPISVELSAEFDDPGVKDRHKFSVKWGDQETAGSFFSIDPDKQNFSTIRSLAAIPDLNALLPVEVALRDDDGGADNHDILHHNGLCDLDPSYPVPVITVNSSEDSGDLGAVFSAINSYDLDGDLLTFDWFLNGKLVEPIDGEVLAGWPDNLFFEEIDLIKLREFVGSSIAIALQASDGTHTCREAGTLVFGDPNEFASEGDGQSFVAAFGLNAAPNAAPETWKDWGNIRSSIDISNETDPAVVNGKLSALDELSLDDIPTLDPGGVRPARYTITRDAATYLKIKTDNSNEYVVHERLPIATPAQLARLNIRANLQSLKQEIVDDVDAMLVTTPPIGPLTAADRLAIANEIADKYIQAVDSFLVTHPGAAPSQGTRNYWLDLLGLQNATNHPWCADVAEYIFWELRNNLSIDVQKRVMLFGAQWNRDKHFVEGIQVEHNWVAIYSKGHPFSSLTKAALNGKPVLYLDPWWDLMPTIGKPGDHQYLLTDWVQTPAQPEGVEDE